MGPFQQTADTTGSERRTQGGFLLRRGIRGSHADIDLLRAP